MLVGVVLLISCLVASPVPKGMIHYGRVPTSVRHVYYAVTDDDSEEMTLKEVMKIAKKVDLLKEIMRYDTVEVFRNSFAVKRKPWKGFKVPRVIDESQIPHIMATLGYDADDLENRVPIRMMKVCHIASLPKGLSNVQMIREAPLLYDTPESAELNEDVVNNAVFATLAYIGQIITKPGSPYILDRDEQIEDEIAADLINKRTGKPRCNTKKNGFTQNIHRFMISPTYPVNVNGRTVIRM